jgi:hypothetical protein
MLLISFFHCSYAQSLASLALYVLLFFGLYLSGCGNVASGFSFVASVAFELTIVYVNDTRSVTNRTCNPSDTGADFGSQ